MKTKRKIKTPYQGLLEEFRDYAFRVKNLHSVQMWHYPKDSLAKGWPLTDLHERTLAANQLGYDVILKPRDGNLEVWYRKQRPEAPYHVTG